MAVTAPSNHRFTVDEWDRLGELGFFGPEDRVELIDGEIVDMSPVGDRHAYSVDLLNRLFVVQAGDDALVRIQGPVRPSDLSEPLPDLALLRPPIAQWASRKPGPADLLLVVEVSDSTLRYDRDRKAPMYGRAGIAECWIVDLNGDEVLVLTEPGPGGYGTRHAAKPGESLTPRLLPSLSVPVALALGHD